MQNLKYAVLLKNYVKMQLSKYLENKLVLYDGYASLLTNPIIRPDCGSINYHNFEVVMITDIIWGICTTPQRDMKIYAISIGDKFSGMPNNIAYIHN